IPRGENRGMKLILIENVPHLGTQGDVVEVKLGYGRNFLLPQGLATYVTPQAMIRIEKHQAKQEAIRIAKIAEVKVLAKEIEKHSLTIEANANEENILYGSVTSVEIVKAMQRDGFKIDESNVVLDGHIKELGLYDITLTLAEDISCVVKVWVVPAGGRTSSSM
ncbi:MAG: 50S ribosomal protein L9, partial [Planctomycetia bacterium]